MGSPKPGLEVAEQAMGPWKHVRLIATAEEKSSSVDRSMVVAELEQTGVGPPTIGSDRAPCGDVVGHEAQQVRARGARDHRHAHSTRTAAADLHARNYEFFVAQGPVSLAESADERLVYLNGSHERSPLWRDHRSPQLVQQHPGGFVSTESELPLELHGRDAGRRRRHQVSGPKPQSQWGSRAMKDGARGNGDLVPAVRALPEQAMLQLIGFGRTTAWASEAIRPARGKEVSATRLLVRETLLELKDRAREVRPRHARDRTGVKRICRC